MKTRRSRRAVQTKDEPEISILDIVEAETVCAVCNAEFLDEEDLKLHVMQVHLHDSNGKTICEFCYSIFSATDEFATHVVYKHLAHLKFCFYCYRAFADRKDEHELKHCTVQGDRCVTCSQCTRIFTNRQVLQQHEYKEHRESEGVMLNSIFPLLSSALNISITKFIISVSKSRPFTCAVCKFFTCDPTRYINHLKTSYCRSIACDKCFKVFKNRSDIQSHILTNWGCQNFVSEIQEQCLKCNKHFNVTEITMHMESCSAVRCPTCSIIFNSMYDLTEHRAKDHSVSVSLTTCKFCKKEFVGTFNLKKHIRRVHKDYRLYKYRCTYCDEIFMHPSKLFAHYFTKHKEIEPYTCRICNKKFRLRKQFTIHIKLKHKSIGFVEFDENLHVIFIEKKSEKPFRPTPEYATISPDISDNDNTESSLDKFETVDGKVSKSDIDPHKQDTDKTDVIQKPVEDSETTQDTAVSDTIDRNQRSGEISPLKLKPANLKFEYKIEVVNKREKGQSRMNRKRKVRTIKRFPSKRLKKNSVNNSKKISTDSSDDEPLSNVKESLLKRNDQISMNLKARLRLRNKKVKLTCKTCNKYCYTVQNYHHHISLHENTKLKKCIKCHEQFKSKDELKNHIDKVHSSSKLTETLKSLLEKRKKNQPEDRDKHTTRPADSIKSLVEKRKKTLLMNVQNVPVNKFRKTIKKVDVTDSCTATITPMSDHGISVKNFIENFRPDAADTVSISNSVTIKTIETPEEKQPVIKMQKFAGDDSISPGKLQFPVKFKDSAFDTKSQVKVTLVQQLITKPKLLNLSMDERIPVMSPPPQAEYSEYCNTFADETDYTQYKNDATIPEVAHEVMLGEADDVPRTKQLAQEIVIPDIPDKYGGVRIGHLLPDAPFYKIVKVKKLLKGGSDSESDEGVTDKNIQLPDGTQLVTVKNPFSHLIPNEHLEELLKANRNKYYTPKTKNIEKALAKALKIKPPVKKDRGKRRRNKEIPEEDENEG